MGAEPTAHRQDLVARWRDQFLVVLGLAGPVAVPALGGFVVFLPLLLLYVLVAHEPMRGVRLLAVGLAAAVAAAALVGGGGGLVLAGLFTLPAVVMARLVRRGRGPMAVAAAGYATLVGAWLLSWGALGVVQSANPYQETLAALDQAVGEALPRYMEQAGIPADDGAEVEAMAKELRRLIPVVFPGVLAATLATTIWLAVTGLAWIGGRSGRPALDWPPIRQWRLPEPLVWGVILCGFALLAPGKVHALGIAGGILFATLYFFQGLAVLASLLERMQAPPLLRGVLYAVVLLQVYGMLLTAVLGLVDVWADLGRLQPRPTEDGERDG